MVATILVRRIDGKVSVGAILRVGRRMRQSFLAPAPVTLGASPAARSPRARARSINPCSVPPDPSPRGRAGPNRPLRRRLRSGGGDRRARGRPAFASAQRGRGDPRVHPQPGDGSICLGRDCPRATARAAGRRLSVKERRRRANAPRNARATPTVSMCARLGSPRGSVRAAHAVARSAHPRSPSARPTARTGARLPSARRPRGESGLLDERLRVLAPRARAQGPAQAQHVAFVIGVVAAWRPRPGPPAPALTHSRRAE